MKNPADDGDRVWVLRTVMAILTLIGIVSLFAALVWKHNDESNWQHLLKEFLVQIWPFTLTTAAALLLYERRLRQSFINELKKVSGPSIIGAMLPSQTIDAFLAFIYGDDTPNRQVVATAIMGGAGAKPDGSDLTISVDTRILLEFENTANVDEYKLTNTTEYTFIRPPKDGRFAIFAISTPELKESIVLSCDLPLFDYWYFSSAEQMQHSIATLLDSVKLSIVYKDLAGNRHISTKSVRLSEVPESGWSDYLAIFRNVVGPLRKRRPEEYHDSMRIFYCNLRSAVANEQYSLDEIDGLKLVYSALQNKSDSYIFWTAAYPSLVKRVEFKADAFSPDDSERHWEFRVVPFSPSGNEYRNEWLRHHELRPLELNTWMLPGHGIVLMWRDRHSSAAVMGASSPSVASIQSRNVAAGGSGDSDGS